MRDKVVFSFGFAYSKNLSQSLRRSFIEAIPNFSALKEKEGTAANAISTQIQSQEDIPWHLSRDFHSQMMPLLLDNNDLSISKRDKKNFDSIEFETLKIDLSIIPELSECPIEPVKVLVKKKRLANEI